MNSFRFDSDGYRDRHSHWVTALIAGIAGALMILLAVKFTGLGAALVNPPPQTPVPTAAPAQKNEAVNYSLSEYEKNIIRVVDKIRPSVVMITTSTVVADYDLFSGPEVKNVQGLASGVIFRSDGYILTNNHVVNGLPGKGKIIVVLSNGKPYPASVVGVDPQTDLAVLKINEQNLPTPQWGDSGQVQVGQIAIAIGNPLAENLNNTVTVGIISARGRTIKVSDDVQLRNMLQTDASINPGNSGGPLVDSSGNVVGINSAIAAASQGIGFSIPSNTAKTVADQLIRTGRVSRPGLGVVYIPFKKENATLLEMQLRHALPTRYGYFLVKVFKDTPADRAGLLPGDVIVAINKVNVGAVGDEDLIQKTTFTPGTKIQIDFYRGNKLQKAFASVPK